QTLPKITQPMPTQIKDFPKTLKFSHDMNMIACSTQQYNHVFAYRFSDNHAKCDLLCETQKDFSNVSSILFNKGAHFPYPVSNDMTSFFQGPGVEGITSATVFESPWGRPFILC